MLLCFLENRRKSGVTLRTDSEVNKFREPMVNPAASILATDAEN